MTTVDKIIKQLELLPHPEGGYFKETYRSQLVIPKDGIPIDFDGDRNACTAIYFLLTSDNFSAFHKIRQDEMWHFYAGSPINLHVITSQGQYQKIMIGSNLERGELPQYVVKGGDWFASEVSEPDSYALAGCTVSPGFDFADFEMADRQELSQKYPDHQHIIKRLTR